MKIAFRTVAPARGRDALYGAVYRALDPISHDVSPSENEVTFSIGLSPFIRYSMFAAFSKVKLRFEDDIATLTLWPSFTCLVPFAIFAVGWLVFRSLGPLSSTDTLLMFLIPAALVGLVVTSSTLRVLAWWRVIAS
jgi:hypothetical protein